MMDVAEESRFRRVLETHSTPSRGKTSRGIAAGPFDVEIADSARFQALEREWRDLVARAWTPNVFMEPDVVAAAEIERITTRTLLVWVRGDHRQDRRLVGVWAFAVGRASSWLPIPILLSPLNRHTHLGTPVLDHAHARDALAAMVDALASEKSLPGIVAASDFEKGPLLDLLCVVLRERQLPWTVLETRRRPKLDCNHNPCDYETETLSRSRRKRLATFKRRLEEFGRLEHRSIEQPDEVRAAFDFFLKLEASGWKADVRKRGHAFRLRPAWVKLARRMISGLAEKGLVTVHALAVGDRPIAIQVLLRSGSETWTWRTAYDEGFRAHGPGLLLLAGSTRKLLSDPLVATADSCNRGETGVMAEFWAERREVVDLILGMRGRDAGFVPAAAVSRTRYWAKDRLRALRDRLRAALARPSSLRAARSKPRPEEKT